MRPKPLIPTRTAIGSSWLESSDQTRARRVIANRTGSWAPPPSRATSAATGSTPRARMRSGSAGSSPCCFVDEGVDPDAVREQGLEVVGGVETGRLGHLGAEVGNLHHPPGAAARSRRGSPGTSSGGSTLV